MIAQFHEAAYRRTEIRFEHARRTDTELKFTPRRVEPLRVIYIQGAWYLFGWDLDRKETRLFAISRTRDLN